MTVYPSASVKDWDAQWGQWGDKLFPAHRCHLPANRLNRLGAQPFPRFRLNMRNMLGGPSRFCIRAPATIPAHRPLPVFECDLSPRVSVFGSKVTFMGWTVILRGLGSDTASVSLTCSRVQPKYQTSDRYHNKARSQLTATVLKPKAFQ